MWPPKFEGLAGVNAFLVQHIAQHGGAFSFFGIEPGMTLAHVREVLGEPAFSNEDDDAQQTLEYSALIDHPEQGLRDHHALKALFWAFHREPTHTIRVRFDYFRWGVDAEPFQASLRALFASLIAKLGKPAKQSARRGRAELNYVAGKHKLSVIESTEGVTIHLL